MIELIKGLKGAEPPSDLTPTPKKINKHSWAVAVVPAVDADRNLSQALASLDAEGFEFVTVTQGIITKLGNVSIAQPQPAIYIIGKRLRTQEEIDDANRV